MARRYFIYSSIIGIVSLVIIVRLAMLTGHIMLELPLLALIFILMIAILGIQLNLAKQPIERSDDNQQANVSRRLGGVVMLAFLGIGVAYCAGVLSRGRLH